MGLQREIPIAVMAGGNALQSLPVFHQLGSDSRISRDVVFFVGRDATFLVQKA